MTKGIYAYTDKKNNEIVYVGKDSNIHEDKRHKQHFQPSRYDKQVINQILQNNPDRYIYQRLWEIEDCTDNHLNEMEKYYTKIYDPRFSFTEGGDGVSGYTHTEEAKKKMSKNNARYWQDKTFSEEHKKKLSERKKGENNPKYWQDKPLSEETKRKISKTESKQCNTTGFYRVSKENSSSCKKGFTWRYRYVNSQNKSISSTDLNKLKEKVLKQGLEWQIIDEEKAKQSLKKDKEMIER